MKRLGLDRVWWLVTPGNPLKDTRGLAPLAERIAAARGARAPSAHRRDRRRGADRARATPTTPSRTLIARCPGVHFVWIMGADNLRSFHRWQNWRGIASLVPIAVVDRVGPSLYATAGTAGQALARFRIPRNGRDVAAAPPAAGLGVPARAQVAAVLDRAAGAAKARIIAKLSHKGRAKPGK